MTITKCLILLCLAAGLTFSVHADRKNLYSLGPTGLSGSISKNHIIIEKVDKGSPADGKVYPKMKLLGVGSKLFKSGNPRKELAEAIDQAESKKGQGRRLHSINMTKWYLSWKCLVSTARLHHLTVPKQMPFWQRH